VVLLIALCAFANARVVKFKNSCGFAIDVEGSSVGVVCSNLGPGATCQWGVPAGGWSGNFHRRNSQGNNLGFPSATLAEFAFGNSLTGGAWNWDWFDISIIPPGCPGTTMSYEDCWCNGGSDGYDVGMVITPVKCQDKTRTCLGRKCDGAYNYPKDDSKTTVCQDISGDFDVEFCPAGSFSDIGAAAKSQTPPCRGGSVNGPPVGGNPPPSNPPPPPSNPPPSSGGSCINDQNIDYFGNDISNMGVASKEACCSYCASVGGCAAWTYAYGVCYAKRGAGSDRRSASGLWSGTVVGRAVAADPTTNTMVASQSSAPQLSTASIAIIVVGCIIGLFFILAFIVVLTKDQKKVERA